MKYKLFDEASNNNQKACQGQNAELEKMIEIQTKIMVNTYHTTCFDIKQLQEVLGVGETNAYKLVRSGALPSQTIGKRKIVPVVAVAKFLIMGEKKS